MGISGAGEDGCLSPLAVARFDAEPLAGAFANLGRSPLHPPSTDKEFLLHASTVFPVAVRAIGNAYRNGHSAFAILQGVRVPARFLPFDPMQTRQWALLLGLASPKDDGHQ